MRILHAAIATLICAMGAATLWGQRPREPVGASPAALGEYDFHGDHLGSEQPAGSPGDAPIGVGQEAFPYEASSPADEIGADVGWRYGAAGDSLPASDGSWTAPPGDPSSPWTLGGWIEVGVTTNPYNPMNPPGGCGNLPVTFNYRSDELQWNEWYAFIERATDGSCGWDFGGRVDLLFGEDYLFTQAAGWETRPDFTNHWNTADGGGGVDGTGRLGLAAPQVYGEAACGNWTLQLGHFYTIIGYESVMAVENFFYSHAYAKQYGEPFTHTGGLLRLDASDQLLLTFGLVNGWDKFDGLSDRASFLFGAGWTSRDQRASLALALITGDQGRRGEPLLGNRTMVSLVATLQVTDRFQYVFQHDYGRQNHPGVIGPNADWYGVNQYLFGRINDRWRAGLRAEWFNDQDGYRVVDGFHPRSRGANWYEFALGLNYAPSANLFIRPEVRWDFVRLHGGPAGGGPFDTGRPPGRTQQFTAAADMILAY